MKLTPVSRQELIRRLRNLGWSGPYAGGNHQHMAKGNIQLTVPNPHHRKDFAVQLLELVLNEAGISRDEWLNARLSMLVWMDAEVAAQVRALEQD